MMSPRTTTPLRPCGECTLLYEDPGYAGHAEVHMKRLLQAVHAAPALDYLVVCGDHRKFVHLEAA